ncbi:MAG: right-handed parallel beta-helix repeat-containing protein [Candidatus Sulfotelmatobacter sp.]
MKPDFLTTRKPDVVYAALVALVLMLAPSLAGQAGAAYYVSTSGNNSNPGTISAPWLTIQHAANTVKAGATVYVFGGVYKESVNFSTSGTASEPITFQSYPGETAVIDGTGVSCCGPSGTQGLINMTGNLRYITISGFEIRNYTTSKAADTPAGVWITGSGTGIQILNNLVHNITTKSEANGNAFGISVYGTSKTPITQLVIRGNEVYDLRTGQSESVNVDGNVTHFQITNNLVHDNDNIGIDAIGYEGVGPVGYDEAMYGEISGNTIYNISGITNPGEGYEYDADGLYCDGCAYVTIERNVILQADYGIETTSENQVCQANGTEWSGPNNTGTAATGKSPCYGRYVTVRNNIFYKSNACGNSIGGYAAASKEGGGSNGGGGSYHDVFVNNSLYDNATQPGNASEGGSTGEFQIQYQVGSAQGNIYENNMVYAGPYNTWIFSYAPFSASYPAPPATLNWNLYHSAAGYEEGTSIWWGDVNTYTSFSNWQTSSREDANSLNTNPLFVDLGATPPNFDTEPSSPAVGAGSTSLSCSDGWCDPNGSSPDSIYGRTDFLGNPRTSGSNIDIGAYENTGVAIANSLKVHLTSWKYTLEPGQATTLTVSVSAVPGGGGVPSGTVKFMLGSTLLSTRTLLPTSANKSAASLPLRASQLAKGANPLTAVYSGNSIAPCCPVSGAPATVYGRATSTPITVTLQ